MPGMESPLGSRRSTAGCRLQGRRRRGQNLSGRRQRRPSLLRVWPPAPLRRRAQTGRTGLVRASSREPVGREHPQPGAAAPESARGSRRRRPRLASVPRSTCRSTAGRRFAHATSRPRSPSEDRSPAPRSASANSAPPKEASTAKATGIHTPLRRRSPRRWPRTLPFGSATANGFSSRPTALCSGW